MNKNQNKNIQPAATAATTDFFKAVFMLDLLVYDCLLLIMMLLVAATVALAAACTH